MKQAMVNLNLYRPNSCHFVLRPRGQLMEEIYRTLEWSEKMMVVLEQERRMSINIALST